MSKYKGPLDDWLRLYEAAVSFKQLRCWEWMDDDQLFGVQNPRTKEIGFCSILGGLGEFFGLTLFLGESGFRGFQDMLRGRLDPVDALHVQHALMVSFDSRDQMDSEDMKIIRSLGYRFRGKHAWPSFRQFEPGYYPRHLTDNEVELMTLVLEQAIDVSQRCLDRQLTIGEADVNKNFLVRVPREDNQGDLQWEDHWLSLLQIFSYDRKESKEKSPTAAFDEIMLASILRQKRRKQGTWEIDCFYAPTGPVCESPKQRPYYPYMYAVGHKQSGYILDFHMVEKAAEAAEFTGRFLQKLQTIPELPKFIEVKKPEVQKLFEPIVTRLGITLVLKESLPLLEQMKVEMHRDFL
ncbi:hypothetical protein H1S01_14675 [Heliobacterium chlorum]|uniref:Uncharacterized protein n=1 Tax=Heliobacterium chlorum TaxID=2698 RepID=A0ABR7T4M4_HELCL|nr:hypothetical protein [Heliobacterium chlorum]MBC9785734.1 hypothetical protein [Heliobacterium chlorum]